MLSPIPAVGFGGRAGTGESKKGFPGSCWGPTLRFMFSFLRKNIKKHARNLEATGPKTEPLHLPWFQNCVLNFCKSLLDKNGSLGLWLRPQRRFQLQRAWHQLFRKGPRTLWNMKNPSREKINLKFRRHKESHWMMMRHPLKRPPGEIFSVNGFQV